MKKKLNILLILLFVMLNISCKDKITYLVKAVEERDPHGGIIFEEDTLDYLTHKGAKIYIEFDRLYDRTKQRIEIEFISMEEFNKIYINNINIRYFDKIKKISIKKDYQTEISRSRIADESYPFYYGWIYYDDTEIAIDFKKLFKDLDLEIGDKFPLSIEVDYQVDDKKYTQEIFFIVDVYERGDFAPAFMYKYFKGF